MKFPTILSLLFIILLISINSFGIDAKTTLNLDSAKNEFAILNSTTRILNIKNNISSLEFSVIEISHDSFIKVSCEGYAHSNRNGYPELPVNKKLIRIPFGASVKISSINYDEEIIDLRTLGYEHKILPHQPSVAKSQNPDDVPFLLNNEVYSKSTYLNNEIASVEILGVSRGVRLARLNIKAIDYNPLENKLKIYKNITVNIEFINADDKETKEKYLKTYSPHFSNFDSYVINNTAFKTTKSESNAPTKYVILADPQFKDSLQNFINWKTQKGFEVIEVYKGENGVGKTPEEMKAHLKQIYESATPSNPAPTFGLIVGDVAQIPPFQGNTGSQISGRNHITDLYYFEYTDDYFPEMIFGRFSANNYDELMPQINKTLEYEKYTMESTSFLDNATLVGGVDVSWGPNYANAHVNYGFEHYFNEEHGYNTHTYLHPNSGANAENIIKTVDEGVGFLKYSGHCLSSGWLNPEFTVNDIYNLTNIGKYPTVFGNCCESLRFEGYSSFGETWLRAKNKGAVGYIGSSNLSYWVEDYYFDIGFGSTISNPTYESTTLGAMDLLFHENGEPEKDWALTNGQLVYAGNMAVTNAGSDRSNYYWETYHLMGDPSLMTYLTTPSKLELKYPNEIPLGINIINIETEPNAYVALSIDTMLLAAQFANATGNIQFSLPYLNAESNINIVATKQNRVPNMGTIKAIKTNEPLIIYQSHASSEQRGNTDTLIDFGETHSLDIEFRNIGFTAAEKVSLKLSTPSNLVSFTDAIEEIDIAEARSLMNLENAFSFSVNNDVFGFHEITFDILASDKNNNSWNLSFIIPINGPELIFSNVFFDDNAGGNGNKRLDPGEVGQLSYVVTNIGTSQSLSMKSSIVSNDERITILTSDDSYTQLKPDSLMKLSYMVSMSSEIDRFEKTKPTLTIEGGAHKKDSILELSIGELIEDFETANFNLYNWDTTASHSWKIFDIIQNENDLILPYSGKYAMQSKVINHNETAQIELTIDIPETDSISFYKKVSSQNPTALNYLDYLEFLIDGESMGKWGGEIDWSKENYSIHAGLHTFTWKYIKSASYSAGYDCAWIDRIALPADSKILGNSAPIFTSTPIISGTTGKEFNYNITIQDSNQDNITLNSVNLPEWLTITEKSAGNFTLSGTAKTEDYGTHLIMLAANDGVDYTNQSFNIVIKYPLNITQTNTKSNFFVYPNPLKDIIKIHFTLKGYSKYNIEIFNSLGQLEHSQIADFKDNSELTEIDLSKIKPGVYFINISNETYSETKKIFKIR